MLQNLQNVQYSFFANMTCPICCTDVTAPGYIDCEHVFCYRCIDRWLALNNTCPLCKTTITTLRGEHSHKSITAPKVSYSMRMDYYQHGFQRRRQRPPRLPYEEQPELRDFVSNSTVDEILAAEYHTLSGKEEIDLPSEPLPASDYNPVYTRTRSRSRPVNQPTSS